VTMTHCVKLTMMSARRCALQGIAQNLPNAENRQIRLVGQPVTLSRTPSKMAARPPEFAEQTDEVLAEFGFGADEIVALKQGKVV
jgi:crotonobetainyl-CoA:carnitine CoA-transferase CaiB-like acyl-CoA transferase